MTTVTVATLNLNRMRQRWLSRRHLVVAAIIDAAPDLLALQEVMLPARQAQWVCQQVNLRLADSGRTPYQLYVQGRHHPVYRFVDGVAIMSRLPVLSVDSMGLGLNGRVALRANVEFSNHETLDFVSTHLEPIPGEREARLTQLMALIGWLNRSSPVEYQVVGGCLEEEPTGPAIVHLKTFLGYQSAFEQRHKREPLATFPTALAGTGGTARCLDYVLLSPAVRQVQEAHVFARDSAENDDTLYASDHVGLFTKLHLF
jgi:endonuclease/exonuclease/phosphatase family metal-dependent hydrolase